MTMDKIYIRILTNKNLGDQKFVSDFLEDWFVNFKQLSPERYAHGEPVNKKIDPNRLEELEREWQTPPSLMFKRVSSPKYLLDLNWRLNKGKDPRPYPWSIKLYLNYKQGKKYTEEFFDFLIRWFEPAYGYVTLDSDESYKHNNALIPQFRNGRYVGKGKNYWGADIGDTLPGVYWLTYISNKILEPSAMKKLDDVTIKKYANQGRTIQLYDSVDLIGSIEARIIEKRIVDKLGSSKFFDLDKFIEKNDGERIY